MPASRGDPLAAAFRSLPAAFDELWRRLGRAVHDRRSDFRTPMLATVHPEEGPGLRTIVLRGADPAARELRFFTDRRSPKVRAIDADARVAICFYDSGARLQLRATGAARVLTSGAAVDVAWAGIPPRARSDYAAAAAPGTPGPEMAPDVPHTAVADPQAAFALLIVTVRTLDLLWLAPDGHRRAGWHHGGDGWVGGWLVP